MNNLRRLDLNLLVVLEALLVERQVSRAARQLGMSQPAVSHALRRLRGMLGDELFRRSRSGLQPTSFALALQEPLQDTLKSLRSLTGFQQEFSPRSERRVFRIAMSDYGTHVVLPHIMARLRNEAPGVQLVCVPTVRSRVSEQLRNGDVDLTLCGAGILGEDIRSTLLFSDRFVCLTDRSHLPGQHRSRLTMEDYLARPHLVASTDGDVFSDVDARLAQQGASRHVAVVVGHYTAAPKLIAGTDMLATIPEAILAAVPLDDAIARVEAPQIAAPIDYYQIWHKRSDGDSAHRWLRQMFLESACAIFTTVNRNVRCDSNTP